MSADYAVLCYMAHTKVKSQNSIKNELSQPNLNITKVGFGMKMTLHQPPPPNHHRELKVINISAVTDRILTKL